ncbi:MAG: lantibiotic dehydratase family protein [Bacteroidales bacterium]|nr:lantibiotic dehydratase family protein [Bacteroidales bacterium]
MSSGSPYNIFRNFILRTPLFPLEFIIKLTRKEYISDDEIKEMCHHPVISEAIYIASPPLFYEMQKWLKDEMVSGKKDEKKLAKLKAGLMRYFLRMSTRCTPFGLFAGFTTGGLDHETNIHLFPQQHNICHTRLDMNYLCALSFDLSKHMEIKTQVKFYPNSSIYTIGEQLRYVEYYYLNSRRVHHIVAVDNSEYLQLILNKAKTGAYVNELVEMIVDDEISFEDAKDFIDELIESQLLVSDLDSAVTGDEFLDQILNVLSGLHQNEYVNKVIQVLNSIQLKLGKLKIEGIGRKVLDYEQIAEELKQLETKYELKYLFQTDMVKQAKTCSLNTDTTDDLLRAFEVLNRLSIRNPDNNLSKFRDAFTERYEDEEISLLHALDNETGIGYLQNLTGDIAPLVDDLALPGGQQQTNDIKWNRVYSLLQKKYIDAIANNHNVVELTDNDLNELDGNWTDLPETVSAMVQIIKSKDQDKPVLYVKAFSGSTAANLIGRFCHADQKAHNLVDEIIEMDEAHDKDVLFAEIAHLPESRTGNILLRPTLRAYEIPYLAKSSVKDEFQLKLDDLYLSVRGNQILLRSKRLNKFIVPRLTSAHNYSSNALPVYQFLCDLQTQNLRGGVMFSWGPLGQQFRFLPRVIYKNIILSRASWNFNKKDLEPVFELKEETKQVAAFRSLADHNNLPDELLLADNDNELYLNLKNTMCIQILLDQVKNRSSFTLKEFLFTDKNLIVEAPEGGFTNEIVVAFHKNHVALAKSVLDE